jgi:hypothetical protein
MRFSLAFPSSLFKYQISLIGNCVEAFHAGGIHITSEYVSLLVVFLLVSGQS